MSDRKFGFGLMRPPLTDPNDSGSIDIPLLCRMVDTFIERGFTYFDTAWMYCNFKSEEAVKEALVSRHDRSSFTLTTKLHAAYLTCAEDRDRIFDEQRRKTGVDYFDYYLLHALSTNNIETYEKYDCFNWLIGKKEQGLVNHIGFSYHDGPELLDKILTEHPQFEFVQLQLNYFDWSNPDVQAGGCYDVVTRHGKKVIVMEPVKGGTLAKVPKEAEALMKAAAPDASVASWGLRFAASLDNVMMVLSGMSDLEQVLDNTETMTDFKPLSDEDRAMLAKVVKIIINSKAIACTGCSYCTEGCPMNIAIPKYFSLYNSAAEEGMEDWMKSRYDKTAQKHGKASDCIGCTKCEQICPQHLPICDNLRLVAEKFE